MIIFGGALLVACRGREQPQPAEPAPPKPEWPTPSANACETAIQRMREIMPEALDPDPAVDRKDCMQLPATLVTCLATIATREEAEACVEKSRQPPGRAASTP